MIRYIDAGSYDDYDRVVRFLLGKGVKIVERDKLKMLVAAELPANVESEMFGEVKFDEVVSIGAAPLGGLRIGQ